MKKILLLIIAMLLSGSSMFAQQRSEEQAKQIAQEFFEKKGKSPQLSVVPTQKLSAQIHKKVASARKAPAKNQSFFVVNDDANNRFVIVSADDRMYQVLGYSENGCFNPDSVPEGLLEIIEGYNKTYDFLLSLDGAPKTITKVSRKVVQPMLRTQWHQIYPYNAECPIDPRYEKYAADEESYLQLGIRIRSVTGCVATAMAQVMNYYKYPACGHGSISYKTRTLNISQSMDFSTMPFDWDNMADTYVNGNYTDSQKNAVARLMHVCGNSVVMNYTRGGAGANNPNLAYALIHYFDYNPNIRHYMKNYFSSKEWKDIIHNDLENGRPIIYSGQGLQTNDDGSTTRNGHAFVLDGCNAEGLYHINWGYNGKYDGYFELTALEIDDSNFKDDQAMVCNITPQNVGETEDLFLADTYVQSDGLYNNTVGGYSNATLNNIYCYSVDANTYNKEFSGEIGIGLFDLNRNFIKSLDKNSNYANRNALSGWKECSFSFTYDSSTFTEGSKFNIAPYAKADSSTKPTFIRTPNGVSDAYNVEVADGKIIVRIGWGVEPPIVIVNNKTLTITCPAEGSTIYYTIGGAQPDNNSIEYKGAVKLTDNRVIKAIAYIDSTSSSVTEKNDIHEFKVSKPTFINPVPNGNKIEISTSDPEDATIYYTVDGSKPNRTSSRYNPEKGVVCEGSTTITAFAVKDNWDDSDINEYVYTPPGPEIDDPITDIIADKETKIDNSNWYTLQGTRLTHKPTQSGIYLHHGKKVQIKCKHP